VPLAAERLVFPIVPDPAASPLRIPDSIAAVRRRLTVAIARRPR
jgi:hypothetical protein